MQEYQITKAQEQRLDKYLRRQLPAAPSSFIYKMLRKKNITLNGRKASGSEMLAAGDVVKLFLSEETFQKMGGILQKAENETEKSGTSKSRTQKVVKSAEVYERKDLQSGQNSRIAEGLAAYRSLSSQNPELRILYEDEHIAAAYKPAGVLSQKAQPKDLTLNEWFLGYLAQEGLVSEDSLRIFIPSVQNRLDRNTEGIVLLAKTLSGSHLLTRLQREHRLGKYYQMVVTGTVTKRGIIEGYLSKNPAENSVRLYREEHPGTAYTRTEYRPVKVGEAAWDRKESATLIEAQLITGKTHQLRAHFASIGHPIIGDPKYGDPAVNQLARQYGVKRQLLLCQRVEFPALTGEFENLSRKVIECPLPEIYRRICRLQKPCGSE